MSFRDIAFYFQTISTLWNRRHGSFWSGAPYYGWDSSLFTEQPIGIWSAFEGKGLSGSRGNVQITDKEKEFVRLPSVLAGMEYKIKYIIKYNGNFERWFNKSDETARSTYRSTLRSIRARFVQEIANN